MTAKMKRKLKVSAACSSRNQRCLPLIAMNAPKRLSKRPENKLRNRLKQKFHTKIP
jgi:hypothetical protein